ncbi:MULTISPECIES: hypothetical protein [Citrobacter]|uniref:hypothetical protein n=1 Tax=Citrobacter TaxID=544 RepID=UPI000538CB53|nr:MULTISPECIES: hypothetical protein [Citrobacter]EKX8765485.1 hypothetical protein [Citrobacter koseri]MBE0023652.1 hypothetical protein [Citrobacter koseri]MBE0084356.1 hypothetical protein [Citrobacter koseri]MBJ9645247.1 hypothetical protein [Citrobacter koseri]MDM2961026.1 hypothetical protein [Citrobacter sp. CK202]
MKRSWFTHHGLTTEQADELVERYRAKGIKTERSLDSDPCFWIVSALLTENASPARTKKSYRSRMWG